MVILHGPKVVDPLAIELAKRERIILGLARNIGESEIASKLQELNKPPVTFD
jgi:predicted transcriptional regulator